MSDSDERDRCPSVDPWGGALQCVRNAHEDDLCRFNSIAWKKGTPRVLSDYGRGVRDGSARVVPDRDALAEVIAGIWRDHSDCNWVSTGVNVVWSCGILHPGPIHMQPTTRDRHVAALVMTQVLASGLLRTEAEVVDEVVERVEAWWEAREGTTLDHDANQGIRRATTLRAALTKTSREGE